MLKAVKPSFFFTVATSVPLSLGGQVQFGWCSTFTLTKTVVDKWKSAEAAEQFWVFQSGHFVPCVETSPVQKDNVPFCVLCLVLQLKA